MSRLLQQQRRPAYSTHNACTMKPVPISPAPDPPIGKHTISVVVDFFPWAALRKGRAPGKVRESRIRSLAAFPLPHILHYPAAEVLLRFATVQGGVHARPTRNFDSAASIECRLPEPTPHKQATPTADVEGAKRPKSTRREQNRRHRCLSAPPPSRAQPQAVTRQALLRHTHPHPRT